ncbi:MAG: hypothetical protein K0V04_12430 [Deltaproteobacteria bacterium]|nr:hypothetical protein [Deltaproteobacteria bacterium]
MTPDEGPRLDAHARGMLDAFVAERYTLAPKVEQRMKARWASHLDDGSAVGGHGATARRRGAWIAAGILVAAALVAVWTWPRQRAFEDVDADSGHMAPSSRVEGKEPAEVAVRAASADAGSGRSKVRPQTDPASAEASGVVVGPSAQPAPTLGATPSTTETRSPRTGPQRRTAPARSSAAARRGPGTSSEAAAGEAGEPAVASMRAELELLSRAQSALRSGRANEALKLVAEHARRFPHGAVSQERAALEVAALCEAGRTEQGRAVAAKFARAYPRSPLGARVREACPKDGGP